MWTAPFINQKYFEGLRWSQSGKRRPPEIIKRLCVPLWRLRSWLVKFWWSLLLEPEQQWESLYWYRGLQVGIQDSGLYPIFQIFLIFFQEWMLFSGRVPCKHSQPRREWFHLQHGPTPWAFLWTNIFGSNARLWLLDGMGWQYSLGLWKLGSRW